MNTIVVLNYGDVLCDNARKSLLSASNRWGTNYTEVTNRSVFHLEPSWHKIQMLYDLSGYDKIMLVDADILIRIDSPNPFEIYRDKTKLYVVEDIPPHCSVEMIEEMRCGIHKPYFPIIDEELNGIVKEDEYLNGFFNTGVMILNVSNCLPMMDMFTKHLPTVEMTKRYQTLPNFGGAHHEQAMINYCSKATLNIEYMDIGWNYINPNTDLGFMDSYVYHFTGPRRSILREQMKIYNWCKLHSI